MPTPQQTEAEAHVLKACAPLQETGQAVSFLYSVLATNFVSKRQISTLQDMAEKVKNAGVKPHEEGMPV